MTTCPYCHDDERTNEPYAACCPQAQDAEHALDDLMTRDLRDSVVEEIARTWREVDDG
jgi:hypothetical protein